MTVLFILISTDPLAGSTKSYLALLHGLLLSGVKAIVVVPDNEGIYDTLKEMGAEVIVQRSKGNTWTGARNLKQKVLYIPRQLGRMYIDYRACRNLKEILSGRKIDIVHSNNSVTGIGRYIAKEFGLPHIFHIREYADTGLGLHYFPTTSSFKRHLKDDNVYTICITKGIQEHYGLSGHKLSRVIYNGIFDMKQKSYIPKNEYNFYLYAGRIEPQKGLLKLLHSYACYVKNVENPLPLKVAGEVFDSVYMDQIKAFVSHNGLEDNVLFLGKVTDMVTLYQTAKAIIISSECEGFGRCMPEAMFHGCITIGKNTAGTKEQFDNGLHLTGQEIGYRYMTQSELTEHLFMLHQMTDEELQPLRQHAKETVEHLYSSESYVNAVLDFYNTILKNAK